jgi:23S rRNA (cytidine1920-2'-O)/16S rRNA (cytidine1409-2'-O)-methyltransferase
MAKRLDLYLAETGLSKSREQAKKEIMTGWVKVNGETIRKPAQTIKENSVVSVDRPGGLYVSRGGEKLHKAIQVFHIDADEKYCVDLGASTGGFTDCLLKHGAQKVYAIDVGYGQLDYSLRNNNKVIVMERIHVNDLTADNFSEKIDLVVADLSFISLSRVYDQINRLFKGAEVVLLLKPQFEAGSGEHKKGVVRKIEHHENIVTRTLEDLCARGFEFLGLDFSPIKGPAGNIEFLLYGILNDESRELTPHNTEYISETIERAHSSLNEKKS